jgi:hypothetical protein
MGAWTKFKDGLGKIRTHLTRVDDEPLGKAALVIIIFLDIFILASIFNGLDAHTRQLSSPQNYIPETCREIVINRRWNPTNRIGNLSQIILSSSTSYSHEEEQKDERHPVCAPYIDLVDQIKNDKGLVIFFEERNKSENEVREIQREIDTVKGSYDTSLLETIAKQQESKTKAAATREDFLKKTAALDTLKKKTAALEQSINNDVKIHLLWEKLQNLQEQDRLRLLTDLRTLNYWYPAKKLGMQMIFLLPLFIAFYAWNNTSIRKNRDLQILVSSHLLGISFIPILCKIIETVYDIIPKKLLKRLMDLLESLKLIAVWHYLIIALAVVAALSLIYLFQKKLFSREKLLERRIAKGECQQCGKHLPAASTACPFCGVIQYNQCPNCNKPTHVHGKFCRECGQRATG